MNIATSNTFTKNVMCSLKTAFVLAVFFVAASFTHVTFAQEKEISKEPAQSEKTETVSREGSEIQKEEEVRSEETKPSSESELSKEQQQKIAELDELLKSEKISQEEYDKKKAEIVGEKTIEEKALASRSAEVEPEAQTLGKYIAPTVSTTNGSLNYSYPIVVPPGRNGLTPDISLTYNSTNKSQSSLVGTGWSFNIPYIQRVNKKGTDKLYTEDHFISSLDGELIDQGNGIYTPRTENGSFLKYEYSNDAWTVTDKTGTTYDFGATTQARQDNPTDTTQIFSWMLETVTDTNSNTISYSYFKDQGQIYPDTISYNQSGLFDVVFKRIARINPYTANSSAFEVTTAYIISQVEVSTDNSVTATYDISTTDNLVKDITITGFEGVSSFELPATQFDYSHEVEDKTWTRNPNYQLPKRIAGNYEYFLRLNDNFVNIIDVNADGLPDFVSTDSGAYDLNDGAHGVWINNGDGTWDRDPEYILPTRVHGSYTYAIRLRDSHVQMHDVNGDNLPDFISSYSGAQYDPNYPEYGVWINNGDKTWTRDPEYRLPTREYNGTYTYALKLQDEEVRVIDINGDGLSDFVRTGNGTYDHTKPEQGVWVNQNSQFGNISKLTNPQNGEAEFEYTHARIQDDSNEVPFPVEVVESITTDDNNGNTATTSYEYRDADYYFNTPHDKKFAGFGEIIKTTDDGTIHTTKYHQANGETGNEPTDSYAKLGKAYEQTIEDSSNDLFSRTRTNYSETSLGNNAYSIQKESELSMQYDGTNSHTDTAIGYEYDSYGNVETQTQYGEVDGDTDGTFTDTGSDKRTIDYTYTNNTTDYIVGLPTNQTLKNNSGTKEVETNYNYDINGNLLTESKWISGSDYSDTTYTYNGYGLPLTETDALSNITTYAYDTENMYPASVTNALSQVTSYLYDYSSGKVTQITELNGKVTSYDYDGLDRLIEVAGIVGNGGTQVLKDIIYNTTVNPQYTKATTYTGTESQDVYSYTDGFGKTIQTKSKMDSGWVTLDTVYDDMGRVEKQSLPYETSSSSNSNPTSNNDLLTSFTYDALGRVLSTVNAKGMTTTDYDGFKTTITDAENNEKDLVTDAFGNLVMVKEYNAGSIYTTNYDYNAQNLLTKITDAESNVRNIDYDGLGRRTSLEDLHNLSDSTFGTWNFSYDDINLTSQTDPKGTTTSYTYDDLNRMLTENNSSTTGTDITYSYDSCTYGTGQVCSITTPDITTNYTYLKQGLVDTESKTIDGVTYTIDTDYDRQGNVTKVTHPNSSYTEYEHNTRGLVDEVKYNGTSLVTAEYGVHGRPTSQVHVNGVTSTITYDDSELYELTNKTTTNGITNFQDLTYSYDNVGNITQIVDTSDTDTAKTQSFIYDDLYRLTGTTVIGSASTDDYSRNYSYSPIGNITAFDGAAYSYTDTGYSNPHVVTNIGGTSYSYDNNGNLTNDGTWTHSWDYRNRLTSSTDGSNTSSYEFDSNNQRIKLVEGSDTTIYPTGDYEIKNGDIKVSLSLGELLVATDDNGTINHIHTDHLGGTNITTDTAGVITQTLDYYPYGDTRIDTGTDNETKQFTGYVKDASTGLNYAGQRYYAGNIGRFISQDPVALFDPSKNLSDPQKFNLYSYARNNPIKYIDPNGEEAVPATFLPESPIIGPQWNSRFVDSNSNDLVVPGSAKGGYFHPKTGEFKGDYVSFFEEGLGIPRNKSIGQNTDPLKGNSTSLEGLRQDSALGTIGLSQRCNCDLIITGGTEVGHSGGTYSHENGYKVDFRITNSLNSFVENNLSFIKETSYGPRYSTNPGSETADTYNKEIRINAPHYDVKFKNKYTYPKTDKKNQKTSSSND